MSRFKETTKSEKSHEGDTTAKEDRWTIMVRQGDFELMVQGEGKEETIGLLEQMIDQYGRSDGRERESPQTPVPVA